MKDLIESIEKRVAAVTGCEPILDEILEEGFSFNVRRNLTDAQFDRIDAIAREFGVEIQTYS